MAHYGINRDGATTWRRGATPDELAQVQAIDAQLQSIEAARAELTHERRILTNRACKREMYTAAKKTAAE